jgi:hypothetical protein
VILTGGSILAHGVGTRQDLPLPFGLAVAGAGTALVLTFVLLVLLWPEPRLNGAKAGRPLPGRAAALLDSPTSRRVLAGLGLLLTAYCSIGLLLGKDDARNPSPYVVYVLLWVGLVPASALLGPVWRRLNPLRQSHALVMRMARLDPRAGAVRLPGWGYWPAAAGLIAFTWLELVAPGNSTLPVLRLAITGFVTVQLIASFVFGSGWFDRGDPFEVWSALYGLLSPLGRRGDGRLVLRSPLAGLDALRPAPGLAITVAVMLGGTAYDGASNAPAWFTFVQSQPWPQPLTETFGLLMVIGLVWGLFVGCLALCARLTGLAPGKLAGEFAPSLVPIAFGYVVAVRLGRAERDHPAVRPAGVRGRLAGNGGPSARPDLVAAHPGRRRPGTGGAVRSCPRGHAGPRPSSTTVPSQARPGWSAAVAGLNGRLHLRRAARAFLGLSKAEPSRPQSGPGRRSLLARRASGRGIRAAHRSYPP